MKIINDYDFSQALRDANEPFGPIKVFRNGIYSRLKFNYPLFLAFDAIYAMVSQDYQKLPGMLANQVIFTEEIYMLLGYLSKYFTKVDIFEAVAKARLLMLAENLNNNNISTDYDLLLKSQYYDHNMKISINENKIPIITSKKYIMVPTYNPYGDVEDTSIEQEHVLGTKEYVLSVGTPKKVRKLVLANATM